MSRSTLFQLFNVWLTSKLDSLKSINNFELNLAFKNELSHLRKSDRLILGRIIAKKVDSGELPLIKLGKTTENHMLYCIK